MASGLLVRVGGGSEFEQRIDRVGPRQDDHRPRAQRLDDDHGLALGQRLGRAGDERLGPAPDADLDLAGSGLAASRGGEPPGDADRGAVGGGHRAPGRSTDKAPYVTVRMLYRDSPVAPKIKSGRRGREVLRATFRA